MGITLNKNEMDNLKSLGLDTSDASMVYEYDDMYGMSYGPIVSDGGWKWKDDSHWYAYTLGDILRKLKTRHSICIYTCDFELFWAEPINGDNHLHEEYSDDPMKAAYKMLCWCLTNGYIE